jgi:hypothetical protein
MQYTANGKYTFEPPKTEAARALFVSSLGTFEHVMSFKVTNLSVDLSVHLNRRLMGCFLKDTLTNASIPNVSWTLENNTFVFAFLSKADAAKAKVILDR